VIDIDGIPEHFLEGLTHFHGALRVEMIYQWITTLIMDSASKELVAAPAPILSRVFQELGDSRLEFNQILQIVNIPIPFPYAQAAAMLLGVYSIMVPLVVKGWSSHPLSAAVIAFFCTFSMWSIELIATEIEHPFGEYVNDLPVREFQQDLNASLLSLLNPIAREVPALAEKANRNIKKLSSKLYRGKSFSEAIDEIEVKPDPISDSETSSDIASGQMLLENIPQAAQVSKMWDPTASHEDIDIALQDSEEDRNSAVVLAFTSEGDISHVSDLGTTSVQGCCHKLAQTSPSLEVDYSRKDYVSKGVKEHPCVFPGPPKRGEESQLSGYYADSESGSSCGYRI